jgi:hypothetical protein
MKTIFSLWRYRSMIRICVLLAVLALIVGAAGCDYMPIYELTVGSTEGGSVTVPGEGTFGLYGDGMVVKLVAEPDEGYQFDRWTGSIGEIDDIEDATTFITMNGDKSITAKFEEIPRYNLTVVSTVGGNVTTPGEGVFTYYEGTLVDLVATPDACYRFVSWIGDVDAIANIDAASTTISTDGDYSIKANFVDVNIGDAGIKEGDWIKFEYTITGWPAGQPHPEWLKVEFLSIEGTADSVKVTMGMSDGTEQSDTVPVDVGEGGGEAFGLAGFVIPPNLGRGDSVYFSGYGDVTIDDETRGTYAGASRTVIYASFSESGVQLTYYWDKDTGVMLEASTTFGDVTATGRVTETNMWEPGPKETPWWPWIVVGLVVAGLVIFFMRRRGRGSATT